MGSFLMNCFVSKQVIAEGAEVVVFPVHKVQGYHDCNISHGTTKLKVKEEFHSICYANSFWEMLGVKIDAIADDYGKQTITDTPMNRISVTLFYSELFGSAFSIEAGENKYHELAFNFQDLCLKTAPTIYSYLSKKKNLSLAEEMNLISWDEFSNLWTELQEYISENRIFIRHFGSPTVQLGLAICLKDAYDCLKDDNKNNFVNKRLNSNIEEIEKRKEEFKKYKTLNNSTHIITDTFRLDSGENLASSYYTLTYFLIKKKDLKDDTEVTKEILYQFKKDMEPVLEFMQFQSGLNELFIKILPMYGGSQDYDNSIGEQYAKMVKLVAKKAKEFLKKKYKDY
jgi:hypothetical protein